MIQQKQPKGNNGLLDILNKGPHDPFTYEYASIKTYYLSDEIGDPSEYIDWFQEIRNLRDSDMVKIILNCVGGSLHTTVQFLQVLAETDAHVMISVEGACMSAATLIFLAGDDFYIAPHSMFLFHNYSSGSVGKGGEMYSDIISKRKWTEALFRDSYTDFLTETEISNLMNDTDLWLTASEVKERLENRSNIIKKRTEAAEKSKSKKEKKSLS